MLPTNLLKSAIPYIIVIIISFVAGLWIGSGQQPEPIKQIKPLFLPSPDLTFDDPTAPTDRYFYANEQEDQEKPEPDTVEVPVPVWMPNEFYITEKRPVQVEHDRVLFQYWNPQTARKELSVYDIPDRNWKLDAYIETYSPLKNFQPLIGAEIELGYKKVRGFAGGYIDPLDPENWQSRAGVRFYVF